MSFRLLWNVVTFSLAFAVGYHIERTSTHAAVPPRPAVLVELFTSEGCSSCSPADRILYQLEEEVVDGVDVIARSEHADYWDQLGWSDPFSDTQFRARHNAEIAFSCMYYSRIPAGIFPVNPQIFFENRKYFKEARAYTR